MFGFTVRRLLISIPVVIAASFLVFVMVANSGDPLAEIAAQPNVPREVIENRRKELNLDKPVITRYGIWAKDFISGDFGKDLRNRDVRTLLFQRLRVTLRMVLIATFVAIILAVIAGVISAVKQYSLTDNVITFFGFLFLSMPVFWLAALLKEYAGFRINNFFGAQIVYTVGAETPNLEGGFFTKLADQLGHLALPTAALVMISVGPWSRYQRAAMLDVLNSDYIRLARAKGLRPRRVMVRHALRNALIPLTTVVAIDFAAILGGAVLTERVFSWQGMGDLLIDGVYQLDVNVVLAWLMVASVMVVLFNLAADLIYAVLDPRIRYD